MLVVTGNGSPKQLNWIARMIETKDWRNAGPQSYVDRVAAIEAGEPIRNARALIDFLKPLPRKRDGQAVNADPVVEAGMYRRDGVIYKVQAAVHGSGNLYAKELIPPAEYGGKAQFVYARGAIRKLHASDKLSLEEAKEFGALYGSCAVCARTLTREESIEAGIGPICASRL